MTNDFVSYDLIKGGVLAFNDLQEELKMGGPQVGVVTLNGRKLEGRFSIPPVMSESKVCLSKFVTSFWKASFKIIILDFEGHSVFESRASYKLLYLKELRDHEVIFYEANHDKLEEYKRQLKINHQNFVKVDSLFGQ